MKKNNRKYSENSIDETLIVLRKYTDNAKCVDCFEEELKKYDETIINAYVLVFDKFLQDYFSLYKPLNDKQKNHFFKFFYKDTQMRFYRKMYSIYKVTNNEFLYSISFNVFKTFWKLQK